MPRDAGGESLRLAHHDVDESVVLLKLQGLCEMLFREPGRIPAAGPVLEGDVRQRT